MELGLQLPPNYLAAMQSGAGLGLALRKQDVEEQRAADQLRRSYAGLAATQEAARMRSAQLSAGNAVRQAHYNAMLQHWENMEGAQNKPLFHFGTHGEVLKIDPTTQKVDVLKGPEEMSDPEAKLYQGQLNAAQRAVDVAKRNVSKMGATKPQVSTGIPLIGKYIGMGPSTNQVPVFQKDQIEKSKAALDAAQSLLEEKQGLLQDYKSSKKSRGGITHTYNPGTGQYQEVGQSGGEPEPY